MGKQRKQRIGKEHSAPHRRPNVAAGNVHVPSSMRPPDHRASPVAASAAPHEQVVVQEALRQEDVTHGCSDSDDSDGGIGGARYASYTLASESAMRIPRQCCVCTRVASDVGLCGGCRMVSYCSQACQAADRPTHAALCADIGSVLTRASPDGSGSGDSETAATAAAAATAMSDMSRALQVLFRSRVVALSLAALADRAMARNRERAPGEPAHELRVVVVPGSRLCRSFACGIEICQAATAAVATPAAADDGGTEAIGAPDADPPEGHIWLQVGLSELEIDRVFDDAAASIASTPAAADGSDSIARAARRATQLRLRISARHTRGLIDHAAAMPSDDDDESNLAHDSTSTLPETMMATAATAAAAAARACGGLSESIRGMDADVFQMAFARDMHAGGDGTVSASIGIRC